MGTLSLFSLSLSDEPLMPPFLFSYINAFLFQLTFKHQQNNLIVVLDQQDNKTATLMELDRTNPTATHWTPPPTLSGEWSLTSPPPLPSPSPGVVQLSLALTATFNPGFTLATMFAMFRETLQAEMASLYSSHQAEITAMQSEIQALSIFQVEGSRGSTPNINVPQPNPTSGSN